MSSFPRHVSNHLLRKYLFFYCISCEVDTSPLITKHNRCKSSEISNLTMRYSTSCSICHKKFRTGRSPSSHLISRHPQDRQDTLTFSDEKGEIFIGPKPQEIPEEKRDQYLNWLSVLVERVNGSLIPDYPGKLTFCF